MKKLAIFALVLVLSFSLVACNSRKPEATTTPTTAPTTAPTTMPTTQPIIDDMLPGTEDTLPPFQWE